MKVVFFGTGLFAVPILRAVAPSVSLVVTQPDRPSGRGLRLQSSPVKVLATELGLPIETPEKSRAPEFVGRLESEAADMLLVASYGQILSTSVLESARIGGINLHGSILPSYRGAAPIQRAILEGQTETGVTLMQMDRGMDTGDIIEIRRTPIEGDETYGELQDRLAEIGADQVTEWLPRLIAGDYPRKAQEEEGSSLAPKIQRDETRLDLTLPASQVYNAIRAYSPSPSAFLETKYGRLKVVCARQDEQDAPAGTVLAVKGDLLVACGSGSIRLLEVQPEGKRAMRATDFANGARLKVGDNLLT